jgi:NodT family efflux transporter outer membrane factor (OMF) lipoprotein
MGLKSAWRGTGFTAVFERSHELNRQRGGCGLVAAARYAAAAMMAALVGGCAVGPDFMTPAPPDAAGYTAGRAPASTVGADVHGGEAQRFLNGRDIPGDWWRVFDWRGLMTLTERALKNNPDLAAAQAALRVAQANLAAGKAALFPTVQGEFDASRQSIGGVIAPSTNSGATLFNLYTGQVSVSYTPDVFGGTRRNIESLQTQSDNQRFQLEATYLTLTSNINVVAAVQEASVRGQIDATQSLIKIAGDVLKLLRTQLDAGQIAQSDVVAQEAALAQIEQTLPPLQRQLEQQRHLLSALTAGLPDKESPEKFTLGGLKLPRGLPLSVPSRLVEQRPDLRAAEENLHSASALIGVAVANRIPNVTLTRNLGSTSLTIGQLLSPGTGFWTMTGSVTQPIFDAGLLYQREVAARATFEQAGLQYRSTVVTALQNVADSLSALRTDAAALQKAVAAEKTADRSLTITRRRLELGDISCILVLNAQQTYFQALLARVQAQANRFADPAALFQALGGGWWNREDREPPKQYPFFNLTDRMKSRCDRFGRRALAYPSVGHHSKAYCTMGLVDYVWASPGRPRVGPGGLIRPTACSIPGEGGGGRSTMTGKRASSDATIA